MAFLTALSGMPVFGNGAVPVMDARLYVYEANTTTPAPTYTDSGLSTRHPNPIKATGRGTFPLIYVATGTYRLRITDSTGAVIDQIENFPAFDPVAPGGGGGGGVDPTTIAQTGDIKHRYGVGTLAGWVRAAGRTISSAAGSGTERANNDCEALFVFLWNADSNLAVSGGRGPNAASDWAANKTIALPDARGRVLAGLDDMGNTAAGRLNGGLFTYGNATTLGAFGGEAAHTLTVAKLPSFTVPVTASMDAQGQHAHIGNTDAAGSHIHELAFRRLGNYGINGGVGAVDNIGDENGPTNVTTTRASGLHSHSFTTGQAGLHAHNITVSVSPVGGGEAHQNLPPFLLTSVYLKL